ncbi:MAG: ABC transporter ATP-binding protein/permease [Crocinitomicaceae bacterium]|nr:ABC transporter ATP-binding protein/permease [Crocinitomicaceae bacterium]
MAKEKGFDARLLFRLLRLIKPHKSIFFGAFLGMILLAVVEAIRPWIIGDMVNLHIMKGAMRPEDSVFQSFMNLFSSNLDHGHQLMLWTMFIIGLLVLQGILQFFSVYLANLLGQSIIRDIRIRLYEHFYSFKLKFFDNTPNGTIVTRMVSDIEAIAEVFSVGIITMFGDILKLILIIGFMFSISWELTLLILIPIPLLIFATRIFARAMKKAFQKERVQVNKLNTFVQEHISGMLIVQLFNRQKREYQTFEEINKEHRQAHVDAIWANSIFFPVVELLSSISLALLIFWAMNRLGYGAESGLVYGVIISFIIYINMLYRPIRQLADKFNILQRGMVRAERVFELLDKEEHIDDEGSIKEVDFEGGIEFNDVHFAYKNKDYVLKSIDFKVPSGKSVALVGPTGAGKSTIINLLTRFYEFQKGDIKIDGKSIRDIELSTLRRNVAIVLQDVFLFSDSIYNNITLGNKDITQEEVEAAAKKVGAHDFISKLPGGYMYNVGERGGGLSTGQRQLISFIRAYVYNPKILILDEATASVDSESEEMIQKATFELQKGRTSIMIAHRLSTIVNSNEILVIEAGKIVERGSHAELLDLGGKYHRLFELNYSGD